MTAKGIFGNRPQSLNFGEKHRMASTPKTDAALLEGLLSGDRDRALAAIGLLRDEGNLAYLPHLVELFERDDDPEVRKRVTNLLIDIHDSRLAPELMRAIGHARSQECLSMLLTVCWSSPVDFSPYLPQFIDIALRGDFMTAFEALTVIENMRRPAAPADIERHLADVRKAADEADNHHKSEFLNDLAAALEQMRDRPDDEAPEGETADDDAE